VQQYEIREAVQSEDQYPVQLLSISKPPARLYYKGNIDIINQKHNIAVIGSRRMSRRGIELASWIGYEMGRRGINVVNGLAIGCDTYALRGALSAGGTCAVVMPCGLDQIVPYSNSCLAQKLLLDGGCLISAYPVWTPVRRYQYVERDCLQSGISDGVLVIEAECDSGTMHTVRYAIKQGKRLACIDSRMVNYSSGNRWLEDQNGVHVIQNRIDLNRFVDEIGSQVIYRQVSLDEFVMEGDIQDEL